MRSFCIREQHAAWKKVRDIRRQRNSPACFDSRGIMWPQVTSGAVGNVINAVINYIFLHLLDLGVVRVL